MDIMGKRRGPAAALALAFLCLAAGPSAFAAGADFKSTVVAGGPHAFMEVRHVVILGTNEEIGRSLGEMAIRDGVKVAPSGDPVVNRLRREYLKRNYPAYYDRMRGVAEAYGLNVEDNSYDFGTIWLVPPTAPGCSAVYYPGRDTSTGHGCLSRNFDFTTGTLFGHRPGPGQTAVLARPILLELHPDRGYSSIADCAYTLLGGVVDGMNSEGLTVALLAEEESFQKAGLDRGDEVGLHETLILRYLLDKCKDVDEARDALLSLKQYYAFIPCHYIVADRSGRSFVFEFSANRNRSLITWGDGPQCITNHLVALHPSPAGLPRGDSFDRWKSLYEATHGKRGFTVDQIRAFNAAVAVPGTVPTDPNRAPGRTVWYALYDNTSLSLTVHYYLGERPDPAAKGRTILEYSPNLSFTLSGSSDKADGTRRTP
jgi:predicted choloylglycine hydrolase